MHTASHLLDIICNKITQGTTYGSEEIIHIENFSNEKRIIYVKSTHNDFISHPNINSNRKFKICEIRIENFRLFIKKSQLDNKFDSSQHEESFILDDPNEDFTITEVVTTIHTFLIRFLLLFFMRQLQYFNTQKNYSTYSLLSSQQSQPQQSQPQQSQPQQSQHAIVDVESYDIHDIINNLAKNQQLQELKILDLQMKIIDMTEFNKNNINATVFSSL